MTEIASLAGGCFWCLDAVYQDVAGVSKVISGYMGGHLDKPSYQAVCSGNTGHAEVVQVHFDPEIISYEDILGIFYSIHNPTTLNQQGADVGTQYRSAIFYHDERQRAQAEALSQEAQAFWDDPIVTEIVPVETFYEAESYHQNYYKRNPYQGYCMAVIAPKVAKFRRVFADKLRAIS